MPKVKTRKQQKVRHSRLLRNTQRYCRICGHGPHKLRRLALHLRRQHGITVRPGDFKKLKEYMKK